jgi:hypothetical protein
VAPALYTLHQHGGVVVVEAAALQKLEVTTGVGVVIGLRLGCGEGDVGFRVEYKATKRLLRKDCADVFDIQYQEALEFTTGQILRRSNSAPGQG